MAKITIDLTGKDGLGNRHYEGTPQKVYNIPDGQLAGGIYNPFKDFGYLSPANGSITSCTGTISSRINCAEYDSVNDVAYFGAGNKILSIDGLDDTSLADSGISIDTDRSVLDLELYEVAGERALVFLTDTSDDGDSMSLGFKGLDSDSGAVIFDIDVLSQEDPHVYDVISATSGNEKFAQRIDSGDTEYRYGQVDRIALAVLRYGVGTDYTIRVGIQRGSSTEPDGTYLAYGDMDPEDIEVIPTIENNIVRSYVDLSSSVSLEDSSIFWIVVEPTVIGEITGTNSFVWYRSYGGNSTLYSDGEAYVYDGSNWTIANESGGNESYDCALILKETDTWIPQAGNNITHKFSALDTANQGTVFVQDDISAIKYDDTHIIAAWNHTDDDGYVQVFSYDPDTGNVAPTGSALEFDNASAQEVRLSMLDDTHFIMVWYSGSDVEVQAFTVDSSYAITAEGVPQTIGSAALPDVVALSATEAVVTYTDTVSLDGFGVIVTLDGSYNVTVTAGTYEFEDDTANGLVSKIIKYDATHVIVAWQGTGSDGFMRVLDVDSATPALTAAGTELEFNTTYAEGMEMDLYDSSHVMLVYRDTNDHIQAQMYAIDGSYDISTAGTGTTVDYYTDDGDESFIGLTKLNTHEMTYAVAYADTDKNGRICALEVDSSYNLTKVSRSYEFTTSTIEHVNAIAIDETSVFIVHSVPSSNYPKMVSVLYEPDRSSNYLYVEEGQNSFLVKADNGLLYWVVGNKVHSIDGSITGGNIGVFTKSILQFPSYIDCVDGVDSRGYLFLAIHSNTSSTGASDDRRFTANTCGVYVWDRQSTVVRSRDYYPIEGAREIRKLFLSRQGEIMAITIGNAGYCELRILRNNRFQIVDRFELNGYPNYSDSLTYVDNFVVWQGNNGIIYAYGSSDVGQRDALHKIGSISGNASGTFTSGILIQGNEPTSGVSVGTYASWADDTTYKLSKWYPIGEGTLDSVAQKPNAGNVYSPVKLLPPLSTVNRIQIYNFPITTSDSTDMGDVKIYFNQSSTPWATKQVTKKDIYKGIFDIPVGQSYVNSIQLEVEWDTTQTLGSDTWKPMFAVIDYDATGTINR